jgi:hypothetical protein
MLWYKGCAHRVIDGRIKIVGIPDFPWICGEDLYKKLKKDYPLE